MTKKAEYTNYQRIDITQDPKAEHMARILVNGSQIWSKDSVVQEIYKALVSFKIEERERCVKQPFSSEKSVDGKEGEKSIDSEFYYAEEIAEDIENVATTKYDNDTELLGIAGRLRGEIDNQKKVLLQARQEGREQFKAECVKALERSLWGKMNKMCLKKAIDVIKSLSSEESLGKEGRYRNRRLPIKEPK